MHSVAGFEKYIHFKKVNKEWRLICCYCSLNVWQSDFIKWPTDLSSISEVNEWPFEVIKQYTGTTNIVSNSILTIIILSFYMLQLSCFTVQSISIQVLTIAFISILFLSKAFFSLRTESRDFCSKSFSCISCEQWERQESSCTVSSSTFASRVCWPSSAFSHCFL